MDLQAQMLRQESGRHASVCGKLIRIHRAVWHVLYKHKPIGLSVLPVMLLSVHRSTTWLHSADLLRSRFLTYCYKQQGLVLADRKTEYFVHAGSMRLAASSFYGKAREMHVERCVLRLLAAARRKMQGEVADPFQVGTSPGSFHKECY